MAYKDFSIAPVSDATPGYQMRLLVKRNGSAQLVTAHFGENLELMQIDRDDPNSKGLQAIKAACKREKLVQVWEGEL